MDEWKSLEDLWEENKRTEFIVISENRTVINVIGITKDRAYGWIIKSLRSQFNNDNVKTFDKTNIHWKLYNPKTIPHYQAVVLNPRENSNGRYQLSQVLYTSEADAKKFWNSKFVRLAMEKKPIMLPDLEE